MERQQESYIYEQLISFMEEGVALLSMNGRFRLANDAFRRVLGLDENLQDHPFASVFLEDARNNDFAECVVDCVYQKSTLKNHIVHYYVEETRKTVLLTTSFLLREEEKLGIILVVGDLTELSELQDAVKAMDAIQRMNAQLESRNRLISQTFGRYLSDEIVRQLLDTPGGAALGGKKQYIFDVAAAGGIALAVKEDLLRPLERPLLLEYQLLDGKYAQQERHSLSILSLSPREAAVDVDLPQNTNLKLLYGEREIFAKVVDKGRLHFTGGADVLQQIRNNT